MRWTLFWIHFRTFLDAFCDIWYGLEALNLGFRLKTLGGDVLGATDCIIIC